MVRLAASKCAAADRPGQSLLWQLLVSAAIMGVTLSQPACDISSSPIPIVSPTADFNVSAAPTPAGRTPTSFAAESSPTSTTHFPSVTPAAAPTSIPPASPEATAAPMPAVSLNAPTATPSTPATQAKPSPTATAPSSRASPKPVFSNVAGRTPADVVAYLGGRLTGVPGGGPAAPLDFSASDILETMDTIVLDSVARQNGHAAVQLIYDTIASAVLTTLREQYGDRWILVPLDAGHGGKQGVNWDPGSEGTEADHNRAVVAAIGRLAQSPANGRILVRPIFNDVFDDEVGLPATLNKPAINHLLVRQTRASMLAAEAAAWNQANGDKAVVHELVIHFNAGAGGAMVLHQGPTVQPAFVAQSLDFARRYLARVIADLNATHVLPSPLLLWGGNGLHDDVMMYRPEYLSDQDVDGITLRYVGLQGQGYLPRYINTVLSSSSWR